MSEERLKIAVFIDFDNVEIGVKTTLGLHFDVGSVLEGIKERGEIITKVAYGDWKRAGDHGRTMAQHAIRLVQRVMTPGGDKNGADINLALDALEMAFTHDHINAFVIVGGDSDFITLVEKLKQYDKKVFVVGGRQFTSQVMQKNCTEFIAYENLATDRRPAAAPTARVSDRIRPTGPAAPLDQALPLVKRALKVLADREVTPQLGLLKSTLLQLDSSFSERDYGAGTFRDFAEKLSERGLVTLKHAGRSTHVELVDNGDGAPLETAAAAEVTLPLTASGTVGLETEGESPEASAPDAEQEGAPTGGALATSPAAASSGYDERRPPQQGRGSRPQQIPLAEGVAMVKRVLFEAPSPPRWPLYLRQMKQFLRAAQPDFDERQYGSIVDLMRACQRDGIVRLERDRQGGLRVFAGADAYRAPAQSFPDWVPPDDRDVEAAEEQAEARLAAIDAAASGYGRVDEDEASTATGIAEPLYSDVEEPSGQPMQGDVNSPYAASGNGDNQSPGDVLREPELPLPPPEDAEPERADEGGWSSQPASSGADEGEPDDRSEPEAEAESDVQPQPPTRGRRAAPRPRTRRSASTGTSAGAAATGRSRVNATDSADNDSDTEDDSVGNRIAPEKPTRARKSAKRGPKRGPTR